jgi:hypothetical protein
MLKMQQCAGYLALPVFSSIVAGVRIVRRTPGVDGIEGIYGIEGVVRAARLRRRRLIR